MNKRLEELKSYKAILEEAECMKWPQYKKTIKEIREIEAANYYDFMMRGDRGVVLALFDSMDIKLAPKELRDFKVRAK